MMNYFIVFLTIFLSSTLFAQGTSIGFPRNVRLTITANSTVVVPAGVKKMGFLIVGGGGGGGGGANGSSGGNRGGGGAGGTGIVPQYVRIDVVPGESVACVIGAAGVGGAGGNALGTAGTAGGATTITIPSFGTLRSPGGSGGGPGKTEGVAPQDTNDGQASKLTDGHIETTSGAGGDHPGGNGAVGGKSLFGTSGTGGSTVDAAGGGGGGGAGFGAGGNGGDGRANGSLGTGYGSGGGGGGGGTNGTANPGNGADGKPGVCIIDYQLP